MNSTNRSYSILALTLAAIGGLMAIVVAGIYLHNPRQLHDPTFTLTIGGLGAFNGLYYLSLHQLIKRRWPAISALLMTVVAIFSLTILLITTGGLDSPFYSLWLLFIVAAGLFGIFEIAAALLLTAVYFAVETVTAKAPLHYLAIHVPMLVVSLIGAGLAFWVLSRGQRAHVQRQIAFTQLSEEQLKAQALMNSMADGVLVVDGNLNIQLINPAAQTLTGWDESSAQGLSYRAVMNLKTGEDKDIIDKEDPVLRAWNNKAPVVDNALSMLTRSNRKLALTMSVSPISDQTGNISGAIIVFRDISAEKEVERQRNEFISTASHEMRTPVAAIEGYIALAMNSKVATIDDRAKNYLDKAHQNTQHLGELFRDLLGITKMETGQAMKHIGPLDLGKMIYDLVQDMQFTAAKKNLTLTYSAATNLGVGKTVAPIYAVSGDVERLREVTSNLIENAIKFTPTGNITVSVVGDDQNVTVSVTDSGVGIPPEDLSHLFQKFYRVDNSATRTIGGTGLGLYLCRQIIEAHNGRIWVESVYGKGSTFRYSLPRIDSAKLMEQPQMPGQPATTPVTSPVAQPATVAAAVNSTPPVPVPVAPVAPTVVQPAAAPVKVPVAAATATPAPAENKVA